MAQQNPKKIGAIGPLSVNWTISHHEAHIEVPPDTVELKVEAKTTMGEFSVTLDHWQVGTTQSSWNEAQPMPMRIRRKARDLLQQRQDLITQTYQYNTFIPRFSFPPPTLPPTISSQQTSNSQSSINPAPVTQPPAAAASKYNKPLVVYSDSEEEQDTMNTRTKNKNLPPKKRCQPLTWYGQEPGMESFSQQLQDIINAPGQSTTSKQQCSKTPARPTTTTAHQKEITPEEMIRMANMTTPPPGFSIHPLINTPQPSTSAYGEPQPSTSATADKVPLILPEKWQLTEAELVHQSFPPAIKKDKQLAVNSPGGPRMPGQVASPILHGLLQDNNTPTTISGLVDRLEQLERMDTPPCPSTPPLLDLMTHILDDNDTQPMYDNISEDEADNTSQIKDMDTAPPPYMAPPPPYHCDPLAASRQIMAATYLRPATIMKPRSGLHQGPMDTTIRARQFAPSKPVSKHVRQIVRERMAKLDPRNTPIVKRKHKRNLQISWQYNQQSPSLNVWHRSTIDLDCFLCPMPKIKCTKCCTYHPKHSFRILMRRAPRDHLKICAICAIEKDNYDKCMQPEKCSKLYLQQGKDEGKALKRKTPATITQAASPPDKKLPTNQGAEDDDSLPPRQRHKRIAATKVNYRESPEPRPRLKLNLNSKGKKGKGKMPATPPTPDVLPTDCQSFTCAHADNARNQATVHAQNAPSCPPSQPSFQTSNRKSRKAEATPQPRRPSRPTTPGPKAPPSSPKWQQLPKSLPDTCILLQCQHIADALSKGNNNEAVLAEVMAKHEVWFRTNAEEKCFRDSFIKKMDTLLGQKK